MRFQCCNVECGRMFGWTAKKIVTVDDKTVIEYVTCPYCGSLDFEENPPTKPPKPEKTVPPPRMPTPANFDPADLMEHTGWKAKKNPDGTYKEGSLNWGWDFADKFKPETIDALKRGQLPISEYVFSINNSGSLVSVKKQKG